LHAAAAASAARASPDGAAPAAPAAPAEESWVRDRGLSEACLFIRKGSVHLLLLILVDSVGLGDRRGCDECKELLESEQWLAL
jgi:hypothetical protein